jgi:hypothetical protein
LLPCKSRKSTGRSLTFLCSKAVSCHTNPHFSAFASAKISRKNKSPKQSPKNRHKIDIFSFLALGAHFSERAPKAGDRRKAGALLP